MTETPTGFVHRCPGCGLAAPPPETAEDWELVMVRTDSGLLAGRMDEVPVVVCSRCVTQGEAVTRAAERFRKFDPIDPGDPVSLERHRRTGQVIATTMRWETHCAHRWIEPVDPRHLKAVDEYFNTTFALSRMTDAEIDELERLPFEEGQKRLKRGSWR